MPAVDIPRPISLLSQYKRIPRASLWAFASPLPFSCSKFWLKTCVHPVTSTSFSARRLRHCCRWALSEGPFLNSFHRCTHVTIYNLCDKVMRSISIVGRAVPDPMPTLHPEIHPSPSEDATTTQAASRCLPRRLPRPHLTLRRHHRRPLSTTANSVSFPLSNFSAVAV